MVWYKRERIKREGWFLLPSFSNTQKFESMENFVHERTEVEDYKFGRLKLVHKTNTKHNKIREKEISIFSIKSK
jgi:hypothetical protein